jgi:hypothetical protein
VRSGNRPFSLMHAAADDCTAGRLDPGDAARILTATLLAAFTPPGTSVPVATALPVAGPASNAPDRGAPPTAPD